MATPQAYGIFGDHDAQPDAILDGGVRIYKAEKGLVIITGCGHRGIANRVRHCQNITGINQIYALVGRFHLHCAFNTARRAMFPRMKRRTDGLESIQRPAHVA